MPIISPIGGGGTLTTTVNAVLAADVTMTTALTLYDGPSASFAAGTWLVTYKVAIAQGASTHNQCYARLWDGTTTYDESQNDSSAVTGTAAFITEVVGCALVTLAAPATLKITASTSANSSTMTREANIGGGTSQSTHNATRLVGVKIS